MSFLDLFKTKTNVRQQTWQELGSYQSNFTAFGTDIYRSDVVRSCIRPLSEFTSKATARCSDSQLERLLNNRPNMYMNGREFLARVRNLYELKNNAMIYISRDERGHVNGLYPVPYQRFVALDYNGKLFLQFTFLKGEQLTLAWEDLAVIRKDYVVSDICGEDNLALLDTLSLIHTTNEGIKNAVKATANLRGILKSTKAMLSDEDIKKNKERFVKDYLTLENEGGIASLDATQEFHPITMSPIVASSEQIKSFRENVYRYFKVNEKVVSGSMTSDEVEAFYEQSIEPFLSDLSTELTSKIYSLKELAYDNWIVYEANKMQFASLSKKIQVFKDVVLYGGMTINEWRAGCNMAPIEGGDEPIRRLDAAPVDESTEDEDNDE